MAYAVVAEERAGRRIVGSVAAGAVSCVAAVTRRRIVTGAISGRRVIGCAIVVIGPTGVVRRSQRAADNGAAEESGAEAPAESSTPHLLHIGPGRISDRKRISERHGRCHIGRSHKTRCQHGGDRHVQHSRGHWLSPFFSSFGIGSPKRIPPPSSLCARYATEIRRANLIRQGVQSARVGGRSCILGVSSPKRAK